MKKKWILILLVVALILLSLTGCWWQRESDKVSYNLSLEADNFNVVRQLTVMNNINGDVLFQMTGKLSITYDADDHQLEIVVEDSDGTYHKHFVGLNEVTTYVLEDQGGASVDKYKYTLNYNPNMWLPVTVKTVD